MPVPPTNCSKCGRPKEVKSSGSLTQWIVACTCDSSLTAGGGETTIEVTMCATCGKRVYAGRSGSFTQWIFRQDLCSCAEPKIITGIQSPSGANARQAIDYLDENEEELPLEDRDYPLERYKPLSIIGEGVSGWVYLSRDRVLGKKVAVKTLRQLTQTELLNFQNSAKANSKLNHPRIVQILDFGISRSGSPFMVMDYVDGRGLDEVRRERGYLAWETVFTMMVDLCDALGYAHECGIMHRDLKPSNMLVSQMDTPHPEIYLIDFGVAEIAASGQGKWSAGIESDGTGGSAYDAGTVGSPVGGADATRRMTATIVGTPAYMSPDTTTGLPYTTRSDIYSLGCVMFECIAGRPPFISDTALETLKMHAELAPPAVADINPDAHIPEDVQAVISKCLEKRPGNRFHSATDLMIALKRVLRRHERAYTPKGSIEGQTVPAGGEPVSNPASKGLMITILAMVILVGLVFLLANVPIKPGPKTVVLRKTERPKTATELTRLGAPKKSFDELFEVDKESKGTKITAKADLIDSDLEMLLGRPVQQLFLSDQPDITDVGCKIISRLPIVHVLLQAHKITDEGLVNLASVPSLRGLGLGHCQITDKGVIALSGQMQTLGLAETAITDQCMAHVAKMHDLVLLNVSDCNISDAGFCQLTQLPLTQLWASHTGMTDLALRTLGSGRARLNCLCIMGTNVSEKGLRALRHMPLTRLELSDCAKVDDNCIKMLAKNFPELTTLAVDDTAVTPASFKTIADMKKLTYLRISRIRFKESDLEPIMTLPNLQSLDLTNTTVSDRIFDKLAKMPSLKEVTCNECANLTLAGLKKAQARFTINSRKLLDIVGDSDFSKFFDIDPKSAKPESEEMKGP
jgi:serine/threonine protein kinase